MDQRLATNTPGEEASDTDAHYVGFWARFLAFIVDSIWVTIIIGLIVVAAYGGPANQSARRRGYRRRSSAVVRGGSEGTAAVG